MEQLNRHPRKHAEPHPIDGMLSIAGKLITAPIRGLHYIEKSLTGTYTADQDFFSRYQWTKHHVEDLHTSLESPNFWVKWSREGSATYLEIKSELLALHRQQEKARTIYTRHRYHHRHCRHPRCLSTRDIACTDLASLGTKLHDIDLHITKASGQSYIDKKRQDAAEIQASIASLRNTPVESSWEAWLLKHQATCQTLESAIANLNHTTYLCVPEGREKLQGINTGELNTLLYTALVDIAKAHYTSHAQNEYYTLYESTQKALSTLEQDYTAYHNTWSNYLWSHWEKTHSQDAYTLHAQLTTLRELQRNLTTISRDPLSSLYPLQKTFNHLFRSYIPPERRTPFPFTPDTYIRHPLTSMPDTWRRHPHRGPVIHTGEPDLTHTLHLAFSDPRLAEQTTTENEELDKLHHQFLNATWNIQWDALYQLITKPAAQKPTHPYQQFIATYQKLTSTHAIYPLRGARLNRETIFSSQTTLTLECAPDHTLETLLGSSILDSPPEYLIINLQRTRETQNTPVGIQEEVFLLPTQTTSHKGAVYELISFTSSDTHYRKTPLGYTRIRNTLEEITPLDFIINAQTATTCVLRRNNADIPEPELFQRAQDNRLRFFALQFKISAIQAIYGQSTFQIPEPHQKTFQHLVDFMQLVAKAPSLPERMLGKNPNHDLERAFQKLPKTLQTFLLNIFQTPNANPALLRDLRTHLLTSEEPLSIPPIPGQQKHDLDRFVLTLIADRLVKHFETQTDTLLKNAGHTFLLQASLHAVSQSVQAKRRRIIRYSVAAEEAVQLSVTLVFSNYLEKGEEFVIRQAISSGSRLMTIMGDPLQESRLFQTAMRTTTAILLLGQSLDNPELSERDVTNTMRQFFTRQGIALISLESIPQPVQDLAIATLSSAIFRSPSHLINWGVSTTFTLINTTLVDDLPPDVPQSNLNFYAARVLNPLSTNAALQAFTAEKVTQVGLRLLRSLEDSDHTTEDLTPSLPLEEAIAEAPPETQQAIDHLPKPQLVHSEYYIDTRDSFRVYDNPRLEGNDYGKFNSQQEAQKFIQELKGVHVADNNRQLSLYNLKAKALLLGINPDDLPSDPHFTNIRLSLEVTTDSVKLYRGNQRVFKVSNGTVKKSSERFDKGMTEAKKHVHTHNVTNDHLLQDFATQLQPLLPPHIMAPDPLQKAFPIIKHTNTVCTLTPAGEVADRITFQTRDQAESIRTFHAGHEVDTYTCQTIRFEMEKQAVQHGIAIESIPQCAPFVQTELQVEVRGRRHFSLRVNGKTAHTFKGSTAFVDLEDRLSHYRTTDRGANQRTLNQYQTQLSTLTGTPIIQTRTKSSTRSRLIKEMLPPVKKEKEHGLWFTGWRSAKATGSKGVQWLRNIGLSGVSIDVANVDFNAPKPTHSTPSYAGTYGPDVAQTAASPALSYTHATATPSPVENWGWQDVEEMQQHQMFERNMAYQSPVNSSPQAPIDYQTLWGEGVGPGVQLPPTTFDGAQLNNATVAPTETPSYEPSPALGLLPYLVVKVVNHVKTHGLRPTSSERPQQAPLVYSPYMRAHHRQTLSLETLPTPERRVGRELLEYVDQVVNQYAYETEHNFFQSNIDTHIGSLKGFGSFIKETSKVIIVIGTPFLSRHQLEATLDHIDSSTSVLDAHFNRAFQHINPSYNPDSASSKMGTLIGEYVIPSLIPTGIAFQGSSHTVVYIHPEALTQRLQHILHTLENPRLPSLDRLFVPNGRPAFAGGRISPFQQSQGKLEMQMPRSSTNRASSSKLPEKASSTKAINLPAFKKMKIDIDHAASGHLTDGYRAMCKGSKKSLFSEGTTREQLEKIIEHVYKNCKKVRTQAEGKIVVIGEHEGQKIKMHINTEDKIIETAYPIQ
jgi:hypothetical protein